MNKEEMIKALREIVADAETSEGLIAQFTVYSMMKIKIMELIKNEEEEDELTPIELKAVERAEEDYKAGRYYTHEEVGKLLGLDEDEEK